MVSELHVEPSVRFSCPGYVVAVYEGTLIQLIRSVDSQFGRAVVYEGDDVMVAALRAIHASFARHTNQSMRPQLFESTTSAVRWLKLEVTQLACSELESHVQSLRERFQRP